MVHVHWILLSIRMKITKQSIAEFTSNFHWFIIKFSKCIVTSPACCPPKFIDFSEYCCVSREYLWQILISVIFFSACFYVALWLSLDGVLWTNLDGILIDIWAVSIGHNGAIQICNLNWTNDSVNILRICLLHNYILSTWIYVSEQ